MSSMYLGLLGIPAGMEWIVLLVLGLLLFGKKLPGLARSVGQSVVEFKKGIKGVKDDAEAQSETQSNRENYRIPAQEARPIIETEATASAKAPAEPAK